MKKEKYLQGGIEGISIVFILLVVIAYLLFYEEDPLLSPENIFVARVIFSEAALQCSDDERHLVVLVIKNRINHPGFGQGKLSSMHDVVTQAGAFSCIDDTNNNNWARSKHFADFNEKENTIWKQCLYLTQNDLTGPTDVVYFHDKSINKPSSWDNKWWTAHKKTETEHFIFYSITNR